MVSCRVRNIETLDFAEGDGRDQRDLSYLSSPLSDMVRLFQPLLPAVQHLLLVLLYNKSRPLAEEMMKVRAVGCGIL